MEEHSPTVILLLYGLENSRMEMKPCTIAEYPVYNEIHRDGGSTLINSFLNNRYNQSIENYSTVQYNTGSKVTVRKKCNIRNYTPSIR